MIARAKPIPRSNLLRNLEDGRGVLLLITPAGIGAIGVEPGDVHTHMEGSDADSAPTGAAGAAAANGRLNRPVRPRGAQRGTQRPVCARRATDQAGGAGGDAEAAGRRTIAQLVEATGWQPHTVRGAFAGALKKKLGLIIASEKVEGTRVYRIA